MLRVVVTEVARVKANEWRSVCVIDWVAWQRGGGWVLFIDVHVERGWRLSKGR